ncbi:glutathione S-transferase [Falsigemmobacter faecalis]|uniref:Glutathione S-transferase n=1 Tax=Falsigemmobacter faecalis TaxID=2488730 RepID=A0A3P3DCY9_9RHOB|nr:glutathione S-transferase [Falsigemmobacter faecalis]RRH71486.1 glutathione S-transferase [Falsigemmobacter faecalis]
MRLFYSPTSPYVRKVMTVLHETGQLAQVELVTSGGTPYETAARPAASNPLGKVPALERPEGPALYDSRVITRYLDARAKGGLYPEGETLWEALTLEATADGILDAALLMVYEGRLRPEDKHVPEFVEAQWVKIDRALAALEERWMAHLHGPFGIGQIAVLAALGYLDLRHAARGWREARPELAAWFDAQAARPSFAATAP